MNLYLADQFDRGEQRTEVLMRLMKKWMMLSLGGGVLVTVVLLLFADVLMMIVTDVLGPLEAVAKMVFWPVTATLHLPRSEYWCSTEKPERVDAFSIFRRQISLPSTSKQTSSPLP